MSLCASCQDETNRWLDHRKPLHLGIRIAVSGNPLFTIPSHVRTHATLVAQVRLIEEFCAKNHGEITLTAAA